ncbi:MAG TPA: hypothetical protein VJP83_13105, partial [Terriglobales bacterium]|nr:hypothetical protein [Terriglobales bacterium]
MKPVLRWCAAVLLLSALSLAQSGSSAKPASDTSNPPAGITENDVKELREALAAQQKQIAAQQQQLRQQQEMLQRLSQTLETQKSSQAAEQQAATPP